MSSTSLQNFSTQVKNRLRLSFSFLHYYDAGALRVSYLSFESLHTEDVYVSLPRRPWRNHLQSTAEVFDQTSCVHARLFALRNSHSIITFVISMILDKNVSQGFLSKKSPAPFPAGYLVRQNEIHWEYLYPP